MKVGCVVYFTGLWNLIDCGASGCLLAGGACHFTGSLAGLRSVGAFGVALKCFGLVDYLRSFPATGSLVRMISVSRTLRQLVYCVSINDLIKPLCCAILCSFGR